MEGLMGSRIPGRTHLRHPFITLALAVSFAGAAGSGQGQKQDFENAAAFARLYGVVRYFYPSDPAANLDWNRFVVHGMAQARTAQNAKALEASLKALVNPLGPGIEIGQKLPPPPALGSPDSALIAWRYFGAGMSAQNMPNVYKGKRTHRALVGFATVDGFATMMQTVPALNLRGKAIRLRGMVRATPRDPTGSAALWLRVDRPDQQMGFFDNMANRPIRDPQWREYVIEGTVADDATNVAFGAMASGGVTADFESIVVDLRGADGAWSPVPIKDPGFEAAPDAGSEGWSRAGTSKSAQITRPADQAPEGRQFLRIAPAAGPPSNAEAFESAAPVTGAHVDIDLGSGLRARVPLALTEAQATGSAGTASALEALRKAIAAISEPSDVPDVDTRLADVAVAWNVFRHFYPYWSEVRVNWDARLQPLLELAYAAKTRQEHRDALRALVADIHDGHGMVTDLRRKTVQGMLPIQLGLFDGRIAITASGAPADAPVGGIVTSFDGVPADRRLADAMRLASGTTQWRQARALREILACAPDAAVALVVETGTGPRSSSLRCEVKPSIAEKRPDSVAEMSPGVWYVDLTRARMQAITPVLDKLAAATGVVFDVRGYPTDAGVQVLPYLLETAEADRWMHVNKIVGPFGQSAGWESVGWNLKPSAPRLAGKIVFLTDGRAISYAESVMGYIADRKLATIVGGPTAGANGNVATFAVPGGFSVSFTGMRVTGHDGRTPHHLAGVKPDIPIAPTIAGLRAGRDEVLERGLAVIRGQ
jgi:Peptidase family S41